PSRRGPGSDVGGASPGMSMGPVRAAACSSVDGRPETRGRPQARQAMGRGVLSGTATGVWDQGQVTCMKHFSPGNGGQAWFSYGNRCGLTSPREVGERRGSETVYPAPS